jgi:hypothetical protein
VKELMFRGQVVYFAPGTDDAYDLFINTIEKEENMKTYEKIKEDQYGRSLAKIQYKDDSNGYAIIDNENNFVVGSFSDTLKELRKLVNSDSIWKMMYSDLFRK